MHLLDIVILPHLHMLPVPRSITGSCAYPFPYEYHDLEDRTCWCYPTAISTMVYPLFSVVKDRFFRRSFLE